MLFTAEQREHIRDLLVSRAREDSRIVAAAAIGASASGGDRWSDLDLTFGIAEGTPVEDVLGDWTEFMVRELDAAVLFDLPFRTIIYRVFLLPGMLQIDLSFSLAAEFGALGSRFHLLFGEAVEHPFPQPPPIQHLFGLAVHHAVRARLCIERGRLWQAEYWIHSLRDEGLAIACRRRGLEASHGRGLDKLPTEVLAAWESALPASIDREALRRALEAAIAALLNGSGDDLLPAGWLRRALAELSHDAAP